MRTNFSKKLAVFLTALMLVQMIPVAFVNALADGAVSIFGELFGVETYHTVTFVNDGALLATQFVQEGAYAIAPEDPTRPPKPGDGEDVGVRFIGWVSDTGISVNDPIGSTDVVFTAQYEAIQKATVTIKYVVSDDNLPALSSLPPDRVYYVEKGKPADIKEAAPLILGYKAVDPKVSVEGGVAYIVYNEVVNENVSFEVNYDRQADIRYMANHWFEKEGIAGDPVVPSDEPGSTQVDPTQQFVNLHTSAWSESLLYGTTVYPNDAPTALLEGFSRVARTYLPLEADKVFDEFYVRNEYLIVFDGGGAGATYHAPQAVKYGAYVTLPDKPVDPNNPRDGEMVRPGYEFVGWEVSEPDWDGDVPGTPKKMPPRNVTVRAKWEPRQSNVTVVYWLEKPDLGYTPTLENMKMSDFNFYKQADILVGLDTDSLADYNAPARLTIAPLTGLDVHIADHLKTEAVVVKGDGSTILNVFYTLRVFTFEFNSLVQTVSGVPVYGTFANGQTTYSIDVKLGQNILDIWPCADLAPTSPTHKFYGWMCNTNVTTIVDSGVIFVTKRPLVTDQMLPILTENAVVAWDSNWTPNASARTRAVDYYFEQLPGEQPDAAHPMKPYNGKNYVKDGGGLNYSQSYVDAGNSTLNPKQIEGMVYPGVEPTQTAGSGWGLTDTLSQFAYERQRFNLSFTSSLGTPADKAKLGTVVALYGQLLYQLSPDGWVPGVTTYVDANKLTYVFEGWYLDEDANFPVSFDSSNPERMPSSDLMVFANWVPRQATVSFVIDSVVEHQITVPGGTALGAAFPADPVLEGAEFLGWYFTDSNGIVRSFGDSTLAYTDMTVEAHFKIIYTDYFVRYVLVDEDDQEVTSIWPTKLVPGIRVGTVINIPDDEMPVEVRGYALDGPLYGDVKLGRNRNENVITFRYKELVYYKYVINYFLEGTDQPVPLAGFEQTQEQLSTAYRILTWAKKDPTGQYYPTKEFEQTTLLANRVVEVNFYYRPYQFANYHEQVILVGTDRDGDVVYDAQRQTRIGDTAFCAFTDAEYTDPVSGIVYKYVEGAPGEVLSHVVQSGLDQFTLRRYFYQEYEVTFEANPSAYGHLVGLTHVKALYGAPFVAPDPVPNDSDSYFIGWTPALPSVFEASCNYVAEFGKKTGITLKVEGLTVEYDGESHSVTSGLTVLEGGVPTTRYTVDGYTAVGATGTNAGTYPNQINQIGTVKVFDTLANKDITGMVTIGFENTALVIEPRQITVKPEDVISPFDGQVKTSNQNIILAPGSKGLVLDHRFVWPQNSVSGQGVTPGTYPLVIVANNFDIVDMADASVLGNYAVNREAGSLTIDGSEKITLRVTAVSEEQVYTGYHIDPTKGVDVTPALVSDGASGTYRVDAVTATYDAVAPGQHTIHVENVRIIWIDASGLEHDVSHLFTVVPETGLLTIVNRPTSDLITLSVLADSGTRPFNGSLQVFTGGGTLLAGTAGDPTHVTLAMVSSGEGVVPGDYPVAFVTLKVFCDGADVTANYSFNETPGNFKITNVDAGKEFKITVRADDPPPQAYTGETLFGETKTGAVVLGMEHMPALANGKSYRVELDGMGSGITPGEYPVTFDAAACLILYGNDQDGWQDITSNYTITAAPGIFRIVESDTKLTLSIRPEDLEAVYNMGTQTVTVTHANMTANTQITIGGQPVPSHLRVEFEATGTGAAPGTYGIVVNEATVKVIVVATGADVTRQYTQSHQDGTFTIKNRDAGDKIALSIKPSPATLPFNGEVQHVNRDNDGEVRINGSTILPQGIQVFFGANGSGFAPKVYDINVDLSSVVVLHNGEIATDSFDITLLPGRFEITALMEEQDKIPLYITPGDAPDVVFDAKMHTAVVEDGRVEVGVSRRPVTPQDALIGVYFIARSGEGMAPGTYPVVVSVPEVRVWSKEDQADLTGNYQIITTDSTFTITDTLPNGKLQMSFAVEDREATYTGSLIRVEVKEPKGAILVAGEAKHPDLKVDFVAVGEGTVVGEYNIVIRNAQDPAQFKVMAKGPSGMQDVTYLFTPDVTPGKLSITWREESDKLKLYIQPNSEERPFSGMLEPFDSDNAGVILIGGKAPDANVDVQFKAHAEGIAPATYYVNATDVHVYVDGVDMTNNYAQQLVPGLFTITPRKAGDKIPVKITPDDAVPVLFDGKWHAPTVNTGEILVGGTPYNNAGAVTIRFSARTVGGVAPDVYDMIVDPTSVTVVANDGSNTPVTGNYTFDYGTGSFEILAPGKNQGYELVIYPADREEQYTGREVVVTVSTSRQPAIYNAEPLPSTLTVRFAATGRGTAQGEYPIMIENPQNRDQFKVTAVGAGGAVRDVTEFVNLVVDAGKLTIGERGEGEKIPLFIRPNSGTLPYNGQPQPFTSDNQGFIRIAGDPPLPGVSVTFTARAEGFAPAVYEVWPENVKVTVGGLDMTHNYYLIVEPGEFEITSLTDESDKIPMRITPDNAQSVTFDGKNHIGVVQTGTVRAGTPEKVVTSSDPHIGVAFTAQSEQKMAPGVYPVRVVGFQTRVWAKDGSNTDVTSNYKFVYEESGFEIKRVTPGNELKMEISPSNVSRPYTGHVVNAEVTTVRSPILVNGAAKEDGLVVNFLATGSGIAVGSNYPIDIRNPALRAQFSVQADGLTGFEDVTDQFSLKVHPGKLSIAQLTGEDRIPLYIWPKSGTEAFTGQVQEFISDDDGRVLVNGAPPPSTINVSFKARAIGMLPGTYPVNPTDVKVMVGDQDMTDNYEQILDPGKFVITGCIDEEDKVVITITPENIASVTFDGKLHEPTTGKGTILVGGDLLGSQHGFTVEFIAQATNCVAPGIYDVNVIPSSVQVTATDGSGYSLTSLFSFRFTPGLFEIKPVGPGAQIQLSLYPSDREMTYTGKPITVQVDTEREPAKVAGVPITDALTVAFVATGSGTAVGDYPIEVLNPSDRTQFKVTALGKNGVMTDVTDQFTLDCNNGTLTIKERVDGEKIPLYIRPTSKTVPFNGGLQEHDSDSQGTVYIYGAPPLPGVNVEFTARVTGFEPGTYAVEATDVKVMVGGVNMIDNYRLETEPGKFTITKLTNENDKIPLYIAPHNAQPVVFDGTSHVGEVTTGVVKVGASLEEVKSDHALIGVSFVARSDKKMAPGTYPVRVSQPEVKVFAKGSNADVTGNYKLICEESSFVIEAVALGPKIEMVLSPSDASGPFTGKLITAEVSDTKSPILVNGAPKEDALKVSFVATGSGLITGTYPIDTANAGGQFSVMADGPSGYTDVTNQFSLIVNPGVLTITQLEGDSRLPLYIRPESATRTFNGMLQQFESDNRGLIWISGRVPADYIQVKFTARAEGLMPGTYPVEVQNVRVMIEGQDMYANYYLITDPGAFMIKKLSGDCRIPVVITPDNAPNQVFDGKWHTPTVTTGQVTIDGQLLMPQSEVTVSFIATTVGGIAPDTYTMHVDVSSIRVTSKSGADITSNYRFDVNTSTFTILPLGGSNKIAMTITPADREATFTGSLVSVTVTEPGAPILMAGEPLPEEIKVAFMATGSGISEGEYPITVKDPTDPAQFSVKAPGANGLMKDVTSQFALDGDPGKLTIKGREGGELIPLYIRPKSDTRLFSGKLETLLSDNEGTIRIAGEPPKAGVEVRFSASVQGFAPGTYLYEPTNVEVWIGGSNVTANYVLSTEPGALTIEKITNEADKIVMYIKPDDAASAVFDGQPHVGEVNTGKVEIGAARDPWTDANALLGVTFVARSDAKIAWGTYPVNVIEPAIAVYAKGTNEDLKDNYRFECAPGSFEIEKVGQGGEITLKLVLDDKTGTYTGQLVTVTVTTAKEIEVGGAAKAEGLEVTFVAKGSGTAVGEYPVTIIDPNDRGQFTVMADGKDVTDQFALDLVDGVFYLNAVEGEKIPLYIMPRGATAAYTGQKQPHIADNDGSIYIGGIPHNNATSSIQVLFAARAEGTEPGVYPVEATNVRVMVGGQNMIANYDLSTEPGKFEITGLEDEADKIEMVIIPDNAQSVKFDGQMHRGEVTTGKVLVGGEELEAGADVYVEFFAASPYGNAPGVYTVSVDEATVHVYAKDGTGIDLKSNYKITYQTSEFAIESVATDPGAVKPVLTIKPKDETRTFLAAPITVYVTETKEPITLDGGALPADLAVTFKATGSGIVQGNYPITILDATDPDQFKVMGIGPSGAQDITAEFSLDEEAGTLKIERPLVNTSITIGVSDPAAVTYNGQAQSTPPLEGVVVAVEYGHDTSNLTIVVNKAVSGTDAGGYPIDFSAGDVEIFIGTVNVTDQYTITTLPGLFTIKQKKLTGKVEVELPGTDYTYGDTIPNPTIKWDPPELADENLTCSIEPTTGTEPKDAGDYTYKPVLNAPDNPNYDISGLELVESPTLTVHKARLTVTPEAVEHAQRDSITASEFGYAIAGYKFADTQATVGPNDVQYGPASATAASPIGTKDTIVMKQGTGELTNYVVTYELLANGFSIYGEVWYHSNFVAGDTVARRGKYESQNQTVTAVANPSLLGFTGIPTGLAFYGWTTDAAGNIPFVGPVAIGANSIDLYAQWEPMYKVTIHYVDLFTGAHLAGYEDEVFLCKQGDQFVTPQRLVAGYDFFYLTCDVNYGSYTVLPGWAFTMPDYDVEIYYRYRVGKVEQRTAPLVAAPASYPYVVSVEDIGLAGTTTGRGDNAYSVD